MEESKMFQKSLTERSVVYTDDTDKVAVALSCKAPNYEHEVVFWRYHSDDACILGTSTFPKEQEHGTIHQREHSKTEGSDTAVRYV